MNTTNETQTEHTKHDKQQESRNFLSSNIETITITEQQRIQYCKDEAINAGFRDLLNQYLTGCDYNSVSALLEGAQEIINDTLYSVSQNQPLVDSVDASSEGYLPAIKIGLAYVIHVNDVCKFIEEGKVRSVGQPRKVKPQEGNTNGN